MCGESRTHGVNGGKGGYCEKQMKPYLSIFNERKLFQEILFLFNEKRNLFLQKEQYLQQQTVLEMQMNEKRLYLQTLYESFIDKVITQTEYQELREKYQNEIENLLSQITCLEEIQLNTYQQIENILNLKEDFQSTQNSEMTKEFSEQFIKRVEVSPDNTVTVTFYFDELLNEIGVNEIA